MRNLQVDQDMDFQRREWRMERAGWAGLTVFVLAACAGAFGGGPLSHATASDPSGQLVLQYERFVRASAASELRVRVRPSAATEGEVAVWIDLSYLRDLEVSSVVPEPKRVEQDGERVTYVFASTAAGELGDIGVRFKPTRAGRLHGRFGLSSGATAAVRQFAFF